MITQANSDYLFGIMNNGIIIVRGCIRRQANSFNRKLYHRFIRNAVSIRLEICNIGFKDHHHTFQYLKYIGYYPPSEPVEYPKLRIEKDEKYPHARNGHPEFHKSINDILKSWAREPYTKLWLIPERVIMVDAMNVHEPNVINPFYFLLIPEYVL